MPWRVHRDVLAELAGAVAALAEGSAARRRFSGKIFACVITESPPDFLRELRDDAAKLPPAVDLRVKPLAQPAGGGARGHRRLHTNSRQLEDFYELADDYDVVVDSLSSFFYFATLFSKGLKLMLNWHFPYVHLACALPVRWRRPVQQNGAWVYPASTGPLLDAHSLVAALERYARTDVRNGSDPGPGSCYDVDEGAMAPYVNAASPLPGAPFYVETPAGGAPVQGLVVRATGPAANSTPRALLSPWTRWPTSC